MLHIGRHVLVHAALLLIALSLAGCLPIVDPEIVAERFSGHVVDSGTGAPVKTVEIIAIRYKYQATVHGDSNGHYVIGPLRQWHYLFYVGDPGLWPDPMWQLGRDWPLIVVATAEGYEPQTRVFSLKGVG